MSTNAAGVIDKVQLIDDTIGPLGSSASRGLPVVSSDEARLEPAASISRSLHERRFEKGRGCCFCRSASRMLGNASSQCFRGCPRDCVCARDDAARRTAPDFPVNNAVDARIRAGRLWRSLGGMTSFRWPGSIGSDHPIMLAGALFISLSIVCGLAFSAGAVFDVRSGHRFTNGYGGRSGAIATVACVFFVQLAAFCGADDGLFHAARADLTDFTIGSIVTIIAACLTGTTVSLLVLRQERVAASDLADKTFIASAMVGLIVVRRSARTTRCCWMPITRDVSSECRRVSG